jgi:hypothetical protein
MSVLFPLTRSPKARLALPREHLRRVRALQQLVYSHHAGNRRRL